MYQRILVPIDGSVTSNRGLDEAIELAKTTGAILRLLHVTDEFRYATGFETYAAYAQDITPLIRAAGEKVLADAKKRATSAGVGADSLLVEGLGVSVADSVIEQASAWRADLIVIGTHGRRGLGRVLMGSDAEQIVRGAPVPVLLVRAPSSANAATASGSAASVGAAA